MPFKTVAYGAGVGCAFATAGGCAALMATTGSLIAAFDFTVSGECLPTVLANMALGMVGGGAIRLASKAMASSASRLSGQASTLMSRIKKKFSGSKNVGSACPRPASSFSRNTSVLMANGKKKKISSVRKGDLVMARNPRTGELKKLRVTALIGSYESKDWTDVKLVNGETIHATAIHPFWSQDRKAWVEAQDLRDSERLLDSSGNELVLAKISTKTLFKRSYNLTIAGYHTYFAGDSKIWVHNTSCANHPTVAPITNKQIEGLARANGYVPTNKLNSWGQRLFRRTKDAEAGTPEYISYDIGDKKGDGSHAGGFWKGFTSEDSRTRTGTYCKRLCSLGE